MHLFVIVVPGDDDDRELIDAAVDGLAYVAQQLEPIHVGHDQIGEYDLNARVLGQHLPGDITVLGLQDVEVLAQQAAHGLAHGPRVVDDQDARFLQLDLVFCVHSR